MEKDKHIVFSYGRMNPPTAGHSKLIDAVEAHAKKYNADHRVVVSHSHDEKKNPVHPDHKIEYLKHIHKNTKIEASNADHPTVMHQVKKLSQEGHTHLHMVVGSDRVEGFKKLLNQYNGSEYHFKKINVVSAGHRDPDAEGTTGISGTKMREHVQNNDYKSFKAGLHADHEDGHAKKLFDRVREGMTKKESVMLSFKEYLEEGLEKERIKHPVGKRPPGVGWVLKQAGEQTGKDHSVWERKFKRVPKPSFNKESTASRWKAQDAAANIYSKEKRKPDNREIDKIRAKYRDKKKEVSEDKGMEGMTQKGGHKRPTKDGAGLTKKGVEKYRRQNPGSKLQTAVTTPPSKLDPDSKAAKRRKSFCARSRSWTGERGKAARRRWNC